jgi:hypothetical protein
MKKWAYEFLLWPGLDVLCLAVEVVLERQHQRVAPPQVLPVLVLLLVARYHQLLAAHLLLQHLSAERSISPSSACVSHAWWIVQHNMLLLATHLVDL